MVRGEALLTKLSTDGESRYLGVLLPESVPAPVLPGKKSPGVGVAHVSLENMSRGATVSSSSSLPGLLLLREGGSGLCGDRKSERGQSTSSSASMASQDAPSIDNSHFQQQIPKRRGHCTYQIRPFSYKNT